MWVTCGLQRGVAHSESDALNHQCPPTWLVYIDLVWVDSWHAPVKLITHDVPPVPAPMARPHAIAQRAVVKASGPMRASYPIQSKSLGIAWVAMDDKRKRLISIPLPVLHRGLGLA